jgi:hypothetical protein
MPLLAPFENFKEEATKFIVNMYHDRKIWLDEAIEINDTLISYITGLLVRGS